MHHELHHELHCILHHTASHTAFHGTPSELQLLKEKDGPRVSSWDVRTYLTESEAKEWAAAAAAPKAAAAPGGGDAAAATRCGVGAWPRGI